MQKEHFYCFENEYLKKLEKQVIIFYTEKRNHSWEARDGYGR